MEIAIVYSKRKPESEDMANSLSKLASSLGSSCQCLSLESLSSTGPLSCDFLVVLGGDGTILSAIHRLEDPETPVLAISYGRGGYLADTQPEEARESLTKLLSGSYHLERHLRLMVEVGGEKIADAINETYVSHMQPGKVIEYSIEVDGMKLLHVVGDGLIVATPLGSTAYSMSSGGPAIDDSLDCFIATPVCPITNAKPLVLSSSKKMRVLLRTEEASVLIDGNIRRAFKGEITFSRSPVNAVFVRTSNVSLFERRLRKRLG